MKKNLNKVLKAIDSSQKILLFCHLGPDADSVASNLAAKYWLEKKGKAVEIFTPDPIPHNLDFLAGYFSIKQKTIEEIDQNKFDLLLSLDCSSWDMITKKSKRDMWKKNFAAVDHHFIKSGWADEIAYVTNQSSTSEIIFDILESEKIKLTKDIALTILTGIYADTQNFKLSIVRPEVFNKVAKLIKAGANIGTVSFNQERRVPLEKISYWVVYLGNIKVNRKYKYCWTTVSKEEFRSDGVDGEPKTGNLFLPIIEGTDFGFSLRESDNGFIWGSFRARTQVDTSVFARALGGGGHPGASAFHFKPGTKIDEASDIVHKTIEKHYPEVFKNEKSL